MLDQQELIEATQELEPLPPTVDQLAAIASRQNWNAMEAEEAISLDPALAGKLLGLANSVASGSRVEIVSIRDAVVKGIAYHHTPSEGGALVCDAVHVANIVARQVGRDEPEEESDPELCAASLQRLGINEVTLQRCRHAVGERLEQVLAAFH